MTTQDESTLGIGQAVERLRPEFPDISASMLRFFERQGLLVPRRTPGGHRLYGEPEIERVRWLRRLQRDERLSVAELRERVAAAERLPSTAALARQFLSAALEGRRYTARLVVLSAADAGMPIERLHAEVLTPVLHELGDRWAAGTLSVAQEHEVSALVRDLLGELAARVPEPVQPSEVVVAACAPGERHDLGLRMIATELRQRGRAVHFLGADVPAEALVHAVRTRRPDLVLLSISRLEHGPALEAALRALQALAAEPDGPRPRVVVGGLAAPALAAQVETLGAELEAGGDRY